VSGFRLSCLIFGLLDGMLDVEGLGLEGLGISTECPNVDVVKEDVVLHGPDFKADL